MAYNEGFEGDGRDILTARDDNILRSVEDLDGAVGVPDSQITRVQDSACKERLCGLGVLVVTPRADVSRENNLANLLSVLLYLNNGRGEGLHRLDNAHKLRGDEAMALTGHFGVHLFRREVEPGGHKVALCQRAIRFRKAVDVDGEEVKGNHVLEKLGGGRRASDCDRDLLGEFGGGRVSDEEGVDGGGSVEVSDTRSREVAPHETVVNLAEAVVGAASGHDGPREGPASRMEEGQDGEVVAPVGLETGLDV